MLSPTPAPHPIKSRNIIHMASRHRKIPPSVLHILAVMILTGHKDAEEKSFPRSEGVPGGASNSVLVLRSRRRYYGVDGGTTWSIPLLRRRFLYYSAERGIAESIPESIPILRDGFGYCRIFEDMSKPLNERKIGVAKISFGVMKKRNDSLVISTKHETGS